MINRGGETLSPFEIEDAVRTHPCVRESMAFSTPHSLHQVGPAHTCTGTAPTKTFGLSCRGSCTTEGYVTWCRGAALLVQHVVS